MKPIVLVWFAALGCVAIPLAAQTDGRLDLAYRLSTAMLMDSNLDHDESPTEAFGSVVAMGFDLRTSRRRPTLAFRYEVARHHYSVASEWNRLSHAAGGVLTLRPARRLSLTTELEMTLKGSSEDRDLGDQYSARQAIEWRPSRSTTIELLAASRIRRYQDNVDRDGINRYAEVALSHQFGGGVELEGSARLERNQSRGDRYRYDRRAVGAELHLAGGFGLVTIGGKAKLQRYPHRLVESFLVPVVRRDRRYQVTADWEIRPWSSLAVTIGYEFERRRSNDPSKFYLSHRVGLSLTRTW